VLPLGKEPLEDRIGGWVGTRASMDVVTKRKTPVPARNQNTQPRA